MKVTVDLDACEAHGRCTKLCPEVFELDEDDVLHIRVDNIPEEHLERVRIAVERCPKQALALEKD